MLGREWPQSAQELPARAVVCPLSAIFSGLFGGEAQREPTARTSEGRPIVRLTDSEVDCVINAARPLDGSAAMRSCARWRVRWGSCPAIGDGVMHRVVAAGATFSATRIWRPTSLTLGSQVPLSWSISLGRRRIRKVATAPTHFAAEAKTFRTRSLGERARK
jgi:hypothetical protein